MPKSTASIIKTRSGKFRVKYYAANGEMLACSEELKTKASAQKNVRSMRKLLVGNEYGKKEFVMLGKGEFSVSGGELLSVINADKFKRLI